MLGKKTTMKGELRKTGVGKVTEDAVCWSEMDGRRKAAEREI